MVTEKELNEAIEELGAANVKLFNIISKLGNKELLVAYREHALKGYHHFCQECALIDQGIDLEGAP